MSDIMCPRCHETEPEFFRPYRGAYVVCDACGLAFVPGTPPWPLRQSATARFEAESDAAENAAHDRAQERIG